MIKSMTGFGRCENLQADKKFTVEMKAVNHRYFDVNIKMPKKLSIFEAAVRRCLKDYIQRGKVDVFITCEDYSDTNYSLKYSENMAREYVNYFRQMAETFGLRDDLTVTALGRCPEVLTLEEQTGDEEEIWAALEKALIGACEQFNASRARREKRCGRSAGKTGAYAGQCGPGGEALSGYYPGVPGKTDRKGKGASGGRADG